MTIDPNGRAASDGSCIEVRGAGQADGGGAMDPNGGTKGASLKAQWMD
jgi:hypothetical protein